MTAPLPPTTASDGELVAEHDEVTPQDAARDLIERFRSGDCPFCGRDPYHYVDNGVGMERVAVVCCDLGIALFQDGDEQLARVEGERHEAAHAMSGLLDRLDKLSAEVAAKDAVVERLRMEAQIHSGEARTHKATVHEAYQACSGGTGEPGNWNGAKPIKRAFADAVDRATAAEAKAAGLRPLVETMAKAADELSPSVPDDERSWPGSVRMPTAGELRRARAALSPRMEADKS